MKICFPRWIAASVAGIAIAAASPLASAADYTQFEARQTHPVRLSADGTRLYALNTPDGRLSVFDVSNPANSEPLLIAEIPVGLEPVSLAERAPGEVWVVNEMSDTVSVVEIGRRAAVAHLPCGDEPADIAFAGGKAFVTAARDNAVRVFDAASRAQTGVIALQSLFPRAMAVSPSGDRLYVAALLSGNKTTILPPGVAPDPPAPTNPALPPAPKTGLIVADSHPDIPYTVLDNDVAEIDVASNAVLRYLEGAGTNLFDVAPRPGTDELWIPNTEALNLIRFEPALRGHFADNRVSKLDLGSGAATHYDLNPDIDYGVLPDPAAQVTSIAQPTAIAFEPGGAALWVAGFGSDIVAKVDAATGAVLARIDVRPPIEPGEENNAGIMRGPRGLALDAAHGRLFVLCRLSNSIIVIDTASAAVLSEFPAGTFDPTPEDVREGRGYLFDARLSGNGTASCATCHIDTDRDGIAWDLGDPGGEMTLIAAKNRVNHDPGGTDLEPQDAVRELHPMKGPKVTQTLRGMIMDAETFSDPQSPTGTGTAPPLFHWRGDKRSLAEFNPTFDNLMGGAQIPDDDMEELEEYLRRTKLHPNPYRLLDRTAPAEIEGGTTSAGRANFLNHGLSHCAVCHPLPSGTDQNIDELNNSSFVDFLKTPPLMQSYQKHKTFTPDAGGTTLSGFGFGHDGTGRALPLPHFYFLSVMDIDQLIDTRAYILSFDSIQHGTAPAVGHTLCVTAANAAAPQVASELTILESRADPSREANFLYWNDVVATGFIGGKRVARRYDFAANQYVSDASDQPPLSRAALLASLGVGDVLNVIGVPAGQAAAAVGDRDADSVPDGDFAAPGYGVEIDPATGNVVFRWESEPPGWYPEASLDLISDSWEPLTLISESAAGARTIVLPADWDKAFIRLRRSW
ncbi:MAG: hypothetical protein R3F11_10850 [Verrucomicrobiales bacterium]